jgi:putative membrane protein insertion efficiency factor
MATELMTNIGRLVAKPLLGLVWLYQKAISPLLGANCRFEPSCSAYAMQALREYGGFKGGWMAIKRISRCHPWGGSGYDPVPAKENITEAEPHN